MVTLIVLVCLAVAAGLSASRPVTYRAETRLGVGSSSLSARAVPGYALATQQLAVDYARYVNDDSTRAMLDSMDVAGGDQVSLITASPIPESNIIRIEVEAYDGRVATSVAKRVGESLTQDVNDSQDATDVIDAALRAFTEMSGRVAAAEQESASANAALDQASRGAGSNIAELQARSRDASVALSSLQIQQQALGEKYRALVAEQSGTGSRVFEVQPASLTGDDSSQRLQRYLLVGFLFGMALGFAVGSWLDRRESGKADVDGSSLTDVDDSLRASNVAVSR